MRYEILNISIGPQTPEFDIQFEERNEKDEIVKEYQEFPTDRFFVGIELLIRDTRSKSSKFPQGFEFTESLTVTSRKSQTVSEIDEQIKKAIAEFIEKL